MVAVVALAIRMMAAVAAVGTPKLIWATFEDSLYEPAELVSVDLAHCGFGRAVVADGRVATHVARGFHEHGMQHSPERKVKPSVKSLPKKTEQILAQ